MMHDLDSDEPGVEAAQHGLAGRSGRCQGRCYGGACTTMPVPLLLRMLRPGAQLVAR